MKISVKINVFNEEANIADVCETVSWADEIVIVDSFSTDRTVEIARRYTNHIYNREFRGYKDKHEYSDSLTTGDWVFWIDADERVNDELRASIQALRERDPATMPDGFWIARRTRYLGRWINHSTWYPDYQMRLYRKSASYWDGIAPHETARVDGRTERLTGEFLHYTKRNLREHQEVLNSYSTLAAEYLYSNGKRIRGAELLLVPLAVFFRTYILKQGIRDGVPGLIISIFTAYSVFLKYAKVWEKTWMESEKEKGSKGKFDKR